MEALDRIPWVEFLASGVTGKADHRTGWAALVTSRTALLRYALASHNRPTNQTWRLVRTGRAAAVLAILNELRRDFESTPDDGVLNPLPDLRELLETYCSRISTEDTSGNPDKPQPDRQLVSWGATPAFDRSSDRNEANSHTHHFTTFDDFVEFVFCPLRLQYGAGWFANADSFLNNIRPEPGTTHRPICMRSALPMNFRFSPSALTLVATARLVAYGWLPLNWNSISVMLGDASANPDSKKAAALRSRFVEGFRIFDLPWFQFDTMTALNVADPGAMQKELESQFTSTHQTDRALLALEFTGYGKRSKTKIEDTGRYFLLRKPLAAVSTLQRLIPKVSVKVISYSRAGSATNRAGVLSRLIDHFMVSPMAPGLQDLLIGEIRSLTYPSLPRVPFELPWIETLPYDTSLDWCLRLEAALPVAPGSGVAYPPSPRMDGKADPLQQIILNSETADKPAAESLHTALRLAYFFLPVCVDSARLLFDSCAAKVSRRKFRKVEKMLDREIRMNASELHDLTLSRTSHFRPLTQWRNLLKFFIGVRDLNLEVPAFLQDWIGSLFRFVWVVPLEPMSALHTCTSHPELRNHLVNRSRIHGGATVPFSCRSTYPGSPLSTRIYPLLFSADPCELACPVELGPLLLFAKQEIGGIDPGCDPCWLTNRLIETTLMMEDLASRIGYVPDIEPAHVLVGLACPDLIHEVLGSLSSETILRSILIQKGGKEVLWEWSQDIMLRVNSLLRMNSDEDISEPIEQLRIFELTLL